jgi:hypothetical protein
VCGGLDGLGGSGGFVVGAEETRKKGEKVSFFVARKESLEKSSEKARRLSEKAKRVAKVSLFPVFSFTQFSHGRRPLWPLAEAAEGSAAVEP